MTAPAAFQATFVDVQTIRTRSVVKLVMEVPVEQAGAALEALGGIPIPGKEPWVAIARLDLTKAKEPPAADAKPKERWHEMKRAKQAGIACDDPRFQAWLLVRNSDEAAAEVRSACNIKSRSELDANTQAAAAWGVLYENYLRETGQQTERRG